MGWTGIARNEHNRESLRYPSDLTDREWALTAPFIAPAKSGGRRRTTDMREVVNALLYVASSGGACSHAEPQGIVTLDKLLNQALRKDSTLTPSTHLQFFSEKKLCTALKNLTSGSTKMCRRRLRKSDN